MGFPDRIERTIELAHPPERVWAALTTAEGLAAWFGDPPVPPEADTPEAPAGAEAVAEAVFAALADPTRRAILADLATHGPSTATDLAGRVPISRQAVAKHLDRLAEAGLVTAEPGERRRIAGARRPRRTESGGKPT